MLPELVAILDIQRKQPVLGGEQEYPAVADGRCAAHRAIDLAAPVVASRGKFHGIDVAIGRGDDQTTLANRHAATDLAQILAPAGQSHTPDAFTAAGVDTGDLGLGVHREDTTPRQQRAGDDLFQTIGPGTDIRAPDPLQ